jgi:protein-disulfide isomerase
MLFMSLNKNVLSALALAVGLGLGVAPAYAADDAAKGLTKDDVEKIVHDYIVANPKLIMDSVDDYQKAAMQKRSQEGMKKNKDVLTKDAHSPEAGNPKGDVTMVEFFDYNCHFCKAAFPAIQSLLEKDKNVRVVFKEFPILGPSSETAAKWALAADKQKKYYEFHSAMMNNKEQITDELLEKVAKDVGMDVAQAKSDVASPEMLVQIEKNRALASDLGLNGTPAFIIGDEVSPGAISLEAMQKRISDARNAAGGEKKE